ncbi:MAG: DMT family transporter [Betaproteobacteria bacterium]|nr:DMT family transporter [Betaproteobacteria bacterium]
MTTSEHQTLWVRAMPLLFVFLWSTGFIGVKFGMPYVLPMTFLALRFAFVVALMLPIALASGAPWPSSQQQFAHIAFSGVLVHAGYLSGVFLAIYFGMSAGLIALIAGMQPILTAFVAAPFLGERVSAREWVGLLLGLGGVALVVMEKITLAGLSSSAVASAILALLSITIGTVYQKRYCGAFDLRTGSVIQFVSAALVVVPLAIAAESLRVDWTGEFIFALAWLVVVLSIGAISLLNLLIRRGAATRLASLFYLVPPTTAVLAYFLFGETLSAAALAGMAFAIAGVALVVTASR